MRHIGDYDSAKRLRSAILDAIAAGRSAADIGGSLGTKAFSEEVAARMRGSLAGSP